MNANQTDNISTSCLRTPELTKGNELPLLVLLSAVGILAAVTVIVLLVQFRLVLPKGAIHVNYRVLFISSNIVAICDSLLCSWFLAYHIGGVLAHLKDEYPGVTVSACSTGVGLRVYLRAYQLFCLLYSGIERYLSGRKKDFNDPNSITVGGVAMLAASFLTPMIVTIPYFLQASFSGEYCYCMLTLDKNPINLFRLFLNIFNIWLISGAALSLHISASRISQKVASDFHLDTNEHSLEERYVVSSNVKLGKVLAIFVAVGVVSALLFLYLLDTDELAEWIRS